MINGCILGLEGVLADTAGYHCRAWRHLAHRIGFDLREEDYRKLVGLDCPEALERLLEMAGMKGRFPQSQKELMLDRKAEKFRDYLSRMGPDDRMEGVETFLRELRERGIGIAVKGCGTDTLRLLDQLELTEYFDLAVEGNDPKILQKAAEQLHSTPAGTIVFEAREKEIKTAHSAGMRCIGIGNVYRLHRAEMIVPGFEAIDFRTIQNIPDNEQPC